MLKIQYTSRFKKDYKTIVKRGISTELFSRVLECLVNEKPLPKKHLDHPLLGSYEGFRECHIASDWLLIYRIEKDTLTLTLIRTGTHNDLF
jgi:mRNA interferase YafQ